MRRCATDNSAVVYLTVWLYGRLFVSIERSSFVCLAGGRLNLVILILYTYIKSCIFMELIQSSAPTLRQLCCIL
jgi:hypothetical protein